VGSPYRNSLWTMMCAVLALDAVPGALGAFPPPIACHADVV
jgi:hypothetical protein